MPERPAPRPETFVSVDIEAAGPAPSRYSMLAIGACLVDEPQKGFYVELKPLHRAAIPSALAIGGLSLEELERTGVDAEEAMQRFADWVDTVVPSSRTPVFVGFNAPFDWMFVADYLERFEIRNPFGHSALDIKAYFMGRMGTTWAETSMQALSPRYLEGRPLSHNALDDARVQAELFRKIAADGGPDGRHHPR